jgi:hypothetical protein
MMHICALLIVAAPAALALNMGLSLLLGYRLSERRLALIAQAAVSLSAIAAITLLIMMLVVGSICRLSTSTLPSNSCLTGYPFLL